MKAIGVPNGAQDESPKQWNYASCVPRAKKHTLSHILGVFRILGEVMVVVFVIILGRVVRGGSLKRRDGPYRASQRGIL
jgi:hypothetical protein